MKPQRTIDFNKVQWADYWWQNQDGDRMRTKPFGYSVHCIPFVPDNAAVHHPDYPGETNLQRARRLDIVDRWHPICILNISANRTLRYTGEQATKVWRQYNAHIYGK